MRCVLVHGSILHASVADFMCMCLSCHQPCALEHLPLSVRSPDLQKGRCRPFCTPAVPVHACMRVCAVHAPAKRKGGVGQCGLSLMKPFHCSKSGRGALVYSPLRMDSSSRSLMMLTVFDAAGPAGERGGPAQDGAQHACVRAVCVWGGGWGAAMGIFVR